jgi:integral membrane protein (TIGR01906 family)
MNKRGRSILDLLVTLTIPIILCTGSILFLLSPVFTTLEYQRPGFPADSFGFSTEERLEYGNLARRYLVTNQTLDVLRELSFEDGSALFNERELDHLEDVKIVIQGLLRVFYAAVAVFVVGWVIARRYQRQVSFSQAISRGGKLTAILLVTILFFSVISFRSLFTYFHLVFFEGDSWLFFTSDTLIRLFPIRFWQDVFLVFGLLTLATGGLLGWGLPAWRKRSSKREPDLT